MRPGAGNFDGARELQSALRGKTGRSFWRSLDELSETPAFEAFLEAEFPALSPARPGIDRRSMLKVMAASLALAGLTGCDPSPDEAAMPYVNAPEFVIPGKPKWYATSVTMSGYAQPVLGKTQAGRPVKLEGNPDHPATRGATDPFMQAALLGLYDPDRSQSPRYLGHPASWDVFDRDMAEYAEKADSDQGAGLRLLTGAVTSPTFARQIQAMLARWPKARWHVWEPINENARLDAAARVFGRPLEQHLLLDQADVVVCLDDDILGPGRHQATHGSRWSERRRRYQNGGGENRLFVAEPTPSITGSRAESRLIIAPGRLGSIAQSLARGLGIETAAPSLSDHEASWLEQILAALKTHGGHAAVSVGAHHAPEIQALGILINDRIGGLGTLIRFTEPIAVSPPDGGRSMEILAEDMLSGRVETLVVLGANPCYTTPQALNFRAAMEKVQLRIHAGLYYDETAESSHWHLPLQHELESWSDARAIDGTIGIIQPLVRPFYSVRSHHSLLQGLAGPADSDRDIIENSWRDTWGGDFEDRWTDTLQRGFVAGSASPFVAMRAIAGKIEPISERPAGETTIIVRPDPTIWDGRFANNAWLQELPKPLTKITWGNAILISPRYAEDHKLANGDELRISSGGRSLVGPAWIMPGQEARTITLTLGYGGAAVGGADEILGYNAFTLLDAGNGWEIHGATVAATGGRQTVATTQRHQAMDGFDFVRTVDSPDSGARKENAQAPSFYPQKKWDSPSWGMSIDLDLCTGCNSCIVACAAENNIPMVGKELVAQGREMHWLRVDHYHEGDPAAPKTFFQPVPCMHCEQAPCEMGCPVNATVHSSDGLNLQVYNRCIGTRTCSAYCPYKVRRFNWFDFTEGDPESIRAMRNPDVTVRSRGVMEKCTYCVQRISEARIAADIDGREIQDGEVVTACQQACPTKAIIFGDITDPATNVSRRKAGPRDYSLLEEANTRPRTTYLARIDKPESGDL